MSLPETEVLTNLVSRVLRIEDVTAGNPREWIVRYRGRLLNEDSAAAYDQLEESLKPYDLMPLFRNGENDQHVILIAPKLHISFKPNFRLAVLLFVLTAISVMITGMEVDPASVPTDPLKNILFLLQHMYTGWPFALSMLGILFAHEMGHYLMCRYYKIPATPPYFLPALGISPLGTLGAFIMMRGIPKNKRILFDVGIAGPLAGLVVAIPVLFIGLHLSKVGPIEPVHGLWLEGNSVFYLFAKYLTFGKLLPTPVSMGGLSPAVYWVKYFFTGSPIPLRGMDVQLNSVALAGWAGLLVTALNLIPVGTLDGGHVAYGLFGDKARGIFPFMVGMLIALSVLPVVLTLSIDSFNYGWILWVTILFFLGRVRADPLDQITELDPSRRALGFLILIIFVLVFTPVPMVVY